MAFRDLFRPLLTRLAVPGPKPQPRVAFVDTGDTRALLQPISRDKVTRRSFRPTGK